MDMARGAVYWMKMGMCMPDQVYISKLSYYTKWYAASSYVCASLLRNMQPGEGTWTCAWECLHAFKKHGHILRHTTWSIVARDAGDNGKSMGHVGSWKVRGTEREENIQFNFQTASAQSTNTKASLQADPC